MADQADPAVALCNHGKRNLVRISARDILSLTFKHARQYQSAADFDQIQQDG
jgi:hypothetical protein